MVNPTKQNAWERIAKLEKEAVENAVLLKMKEDIIDQRDKKIKTLEEFIRSCDEEIKELCSRVDLDGYEARETMARNGL